MSEQRNPPETVTNEEKMCGQQCAIAICGRPTLWNVSTIWGKATLTVTQRGDAAGSRRGKKIFLHLQTVCTILLLICCLWLSIYNKKLKERREREREKIWFKDEMIEHVQFLLPSTDGSMAALKREARINAAIHANSTQSGARAA